MNFVKIYNNNLIETLLIVLLPLVIAFLIYLLFRDMSFIHFDNSDFRINKFINIPTVILYNFPDGLLVFAFTNMNLIIWRPSGIKHRSFWICMPLFFALLDELAQLYGFVGGTFDKMDILSYLLFFILSLLNFFYHAKKQNSTV